MTKALKISIVVLFTLISLIMFDSHLDNFMISAQAFISDDSSELYSIQWNTTYFLRDIHVPHSLIQIRNGDYLVVGNRYLTPCGGGCCPFPQSDVFLMKVMTNGKIEQLDYYGDNAIDMDLGYVVIETEDGYTIAGRTNSPPAVEMDFMIMKTDPNGHLKWRRTYNRNYEWFMRSFIQTTDKGYALLGLSSPRENLVSTEKTMWLLKTDSEGNAQWNRSYGPNFVEYTSMIHFDPDGGFFLTSYNGTLTKTDIMGNIEWVKKVGGKLDSIIMTKDGGLALFGIKFDQPWLVKTDHLGNVEWNRTFTFKVGGDYIFHHNSSSLLNIIQSSDEGFILTGSSVQNQPKGFINDSNLWIVKTNSDGDMEWNYKFKEEAFASIQTVIENKEGDIVLAGEKEHYTRIIKIDLPPFNDVDPTVGKTSFPQMTFVFLVMNIIIILRKRKSKS